MAGQDIQDIFAQGDFNGDGRADFVSDADSLIMKLSRGADFPDLLKQVVEPLGGTIAIGYATSAGTMGTALLRRRRPAQDHRQPG